MILKHICFVIIIAASIFISMLCHAEFASIAPCTPENYVAPETENEIRELSEHLDQDVKLAFQGGNQKLALALMCRAAAANIEHAEIRLGALLFDGYGIFAKDERQARYWLKRSADKGNINAKYFLSVLYREARGGPPLPQEGMRLLREAADGGYAQAMLDLSAE